MTITIEKVDQILDRVPYASYAEAKEALEQTNGDVLDAIIYLEEKFESEYEKNKKDLFNLNFSLFDSEKLKNVIKKAKNTKDDVEETVEEDEDSLGEDKEDNFNSYKYREKFANENFNYENIKSQIQDLFKKSGVVRLIIEKDGKNFINIPIIAGVAGVVFLPVYSIVGLSVAVLAKCQIKIVNEEQNEVVDLGEYSEEKLNMIKEILSSSIDKFGKKADFSDVEGEEDIVDVDIVEDDVEEDEINSEEKID